MQIMTLKQWHSNDRKSKINTRTRVKNKKKLLTKTLNNALTFQRRRERFINV